jgi:hypothetical protein
VGEQHAQIAIATLGDAEPLGFFGPIRELVLGVLEPLARQRGMWGFFGRLKTELFYPRQWRSTTLERFIQTLDSYTRWYNEKRIKICDSCYLVGPFARAAFTWSAVTGLP